METASEVLYVVRRRDGIDDSRRASAVAGSPRTGKLPNHIPRCALHERGSCPITHAGAPFTNGEAANRVLTPRDSARFEAHRSAFCVRVENQSPARRWAI